jgi:ribosomal protein S12 methylthiotransferase accessory factor
VHDLGETLDRLERAGLIERSGSPRRIRIEASGLKLGGKLAWKPLTGVGRDLLSQLLDASEIEIDAGADRLLVTTDDYLSPDVLAIARTETRPWMLARPLGRTMFLGPVFDSGHTCWFCLAHWLRTRRWKQSALTGWTDDACPPHPAVAATPSTTAIAAGHLTTAALRWLHGSTELMGSFHAIHSLGGGVSSYTVLPRADCRCSSPKTVPLSFWTNPLTGLIFDLERTGHSIAGTYQARAQHLRPLPRAAARPLLLPGDVYGAGATPEEAESRCIAEGLERYSVIWRGDEPVLTAQMADLERVVHPNTLALYSESQYRTREEWNRSHSALYHVAEELDLTQPIEWAEVRSLADGAIWHAPAASIYMWHNSPQGVNYGLADSNGCAAGRTMDEAILGGLLELIERDAVAIWWYNELRRPSIDWEAFDDPWLVEAANALGERGRSPVLLDLTNDLGVPAYAAVAAREDGSEPYAGCAAHVDAPTAARKAISELTQNWFWSSHNRGVEAQDAWVRRATAESHLYLNPLGSAPPGPTFGGSQKAAIDLCLKRLRAAGMEAFTIDLTRPEIGLPVCRVIAPGLRHCWMRFAPGRLYDVPVRMGWLERALSESQLNRDGCPL